LELVFWSLILPLKLPFGAWLKPKPATTQLSPSKSTSHSSGTSSDPYECRENTTTEITNVPRSGSISLETVNSSSQRTSTSSTSWVVAEGSYVNPSTGPGSVFITSLTAIPDSFINISVRARNPTAVCTLTLVTPGTGTITITGKVYKDSNNNNTYEVGDRVIPSATVKLEKPAGTSYSPVATTTSNSSGDYLLTYQGHPALTLSLPPYQITATTFLPTLPPIPVRRLPIMSK